MIVNQSKVSLRRQPVKSIPEIDFATIIILCFHNHMLIVFTKNANLTVSIQRQGATCFNVFLSSSGKGQTASALDPQFCNETIDIKTGPHTPVPEVGLAKRINSRSMSIREI